MDVKVIEQIFSDQLRSLKIDEDTIKKRIGGGKYEKCNKDIQHIFKRR